LFCKGAKNLCSELVRPHNTEEKIMAMKEVVLARTDELQDGEMKAFSFGENKVLLSKIGGRFYAVGGLCPHYGRPDEGILHDGTIVLPLASCHVMQRQAMSKSPFWMPSQLRGDNQRRKRSRKLPEVIRIGESLP
jgi:hypothetical protein